MKIISSEIEVRERLTTTSHIQKHPVNVTLPTSSTFLIILSSQVIVSIVNQFATQIQRYRSAGSKGLIENGGSLLRIVSSVFVP